MSAKDFAFVGIRLLAIYLFLNVISSVAGMAEFVIALTTGAIGAGGGNSSPFAYYGFVSSFLYLFFAVLLWISAERLAQVVVPARALSSQKLTKSLDFQAIAFSVVGLLILAGALPKIAAELYKAYQLAHAFDVPREISLAEKARYVQTGLEVVFGAMIFVWGGTLSGLLVWFRELGLETKTSDRGPKSTARKRGVSRQKR